MDFRNIFMDFINIFMDQKDSNFYGPKPNLGDLPISQ
jgi:hypothetical protein